MSKVMVAPPLDCPECGEGWVVHTEAEQVGDRVWVHDWDDDGISIEAEVVGDEQAG